MDTKVILYNEIDFVVRDTIIIKYILPTKQLRTLKLDIIHNNIV